MATQGNDFFEHCRQWLAREQMNLSSGVVGVGVGVGVTNGKNSSVRSEILQHTPQTTMSTVGAVFLGHQGSGSAGVAFAEACQRQPWCQPAPLGISPHTRDLSAQFSNPGIRADLRTKLPAELRNEVYRLLLPVIMDAVNITEPFPPITRTCRQMRSESMPVFLSSRKFHAVVADHNTSPLLAWLKIFEGIDDNWKRTFGGLDIACTGILIDFHIFSTCPHEQGDINCWCPNFELWNTLIASIKGGGLTAEQVQVHCTFIQEVHQYLKDESEAVQIVPQLLCTDDTRASEAYLFSRYIIPSLLRMHGLYDKSAPPQDVLDSLLHDGRFQTPANWICMEDVVVSAANLCNMPPESWFETWALHSLATADLRDAVYEECRRLMQVHCVAQFRGLAGGHVGLLAYHQAAEEALGRPLVCVECLKEELAERRERESLLRGL